MRKCHRGCIGTRINKPRAFETNQWFGWVILTPGWTISWVTYYLGSWTSSSTLTHVKSWQMCSPDVLKLLQQVLAPPVPASPLEPEEESTSPKRAATVLDSDDDMWLGGQQVAMDEDLLKQLRFFFPDTLVVAAFDIVDRGGGGWLVSCG